MTARNHSPDLTSKRADSGAHTVPDSGDFDPLDPLDSWVETAPAWQVAIARLQGRWHPPVHRQFEEEL